MVRDNVAGNRFEITVDGYTAVLEYERRIEATVLLHTEVPEPLRGRGLADQLVRHALDAAKAAGERVIPVCPFVRSWIARHPEYQPLVLTSSIR